MLLAGLNAGAYLVNAVHIAEIVELGKQLIKHHHDLGGVTGLGQGRETDNIHEEDCDILVSAGQLGDGSGDGTQTVDAQEFDDMSREHIDQHPEVSLMNGIQGKQEH